MNLSKIATDAPKNVNKEDIEAATLKMTQRIAELQEVMHAEGKHSLLLVLQGMDTSGKDGVTKTLFGQCSPIGINAVAYKKPSEEEFAHDFLWRVHKHAPRKGEISIFIRSHYEDVLIQRVHGWIDEKRVKVRFKAINAFEELLQQDNNTTIVKLFLHISKAKQQDKLMERLEEPDKFWKHQDGDWEERKLWDQYQKAYNDAIDTCNSPAWNIIPADQRWYRNYCAAKVVLEALENMKCQYPALQTELKKDAFSK